MYLSRFRHIDAPARRQGSGAHAFAKHERVVAASSATRQRAETELRSLLAVDAAGASLAEFADDVTTTRPPPPSLQRTS